ncbi:hypothetical protein [Mucilaginibacter sp. FT3.2]|uniref:hypothetical protein n=1 Tax=Mucilaginibacter sp. FT3.2 TaxID=2723090 RepID=UPI00160F8F1B|nr:hypothetical protein [Mucilaginibacter sp. FT3.2]MBB6234495.1 hypothetical protein [Mucilaginibacter sp. FT3.2]
MSVIRAYFILVVLLCSLTVKAQSALDYAGFSKFVGKGYKLSEGLKFNCEWMYAVVKIEINKESKITKYKVVNRLPDTVKYDFGFLIGYKFSEKMKVNGHSLVFYFSIDNSEICKPKPGQKIFYSPNQVVGIIYEILEQTRLEDPRTIIEPYPIIKMYMAPQQ